MSLKATCYLHLAEGIIIAMLNFGKIITTLVKGQKYSLRSKPKIMDWKVGGKLIGLDEEEDGKLLEYIDNDFVDNRDGTITDKATGLMWQKSAADQEYDFKRAERYINEINKGRFAGHTDWRLPTIDELKSLLEPVGYAHPRSDDIDGTIDYAIDPIFKFNTNDFSTCYWSSDKRSDESAWAINILVSYDCGIHQGRVTGSFLSNNELVKAVRSI